MKKVALLFATLLLSQASMSACLQRDNSPVPFPFNLEVFLRYEKNWLLTKGGEISIRFSHATPMTFNYFMVNNYTDVRSRGILQVINKQMCNLKSSTPFCVYSEKDVLKIRAESNNLCLDSNLSLLGFTR